MGEYFSDRELGPRARIEQELTPPVWAGIVATVDSLQQSGSFGVRYPQSCLDGQAICGYDAQSLGRAVKAHLPGLDWPLQVDQENSELYSCKRIPFAPATPLTLDLIEFVHDSIAQPILGIHHAFARHHHLTFDQLAGQEAFRADINLLFARNGVAYELQFNGRISRVLPTVIGEELKRTQFQTGERTLDIFLEECRTKFSSRDPVIRR